MYKIFFHCLCSFSSEQELLVRIWLVKFLPRWDLRNSSKSADTLELRVNENNCTAFCGETTDKILVNVCVKMQCLLKAVMILPKVFCCPHSTAQVASDVSFDWSVKRLSLNIYIGLNEQREDFWRFTHI